MSHSLMQALRSSAVRTQGSDTSRNHLDKLQSPTTSTLLETSTLKREVECDVVLAEADPSTF